MSLVLDASITITWLFSAERTRNTRVILRRVSADGAVVPSLWRLEVANVLHNAVRRRRCDKQYADRCLKRLARLRVRADAATDQHAWGTTRDLATAHALTLYDAAYLELALRLDIPLASCDTALIDAARDSGVEVLAF